MKIKNIAFSGFMATILMAGAAYAVEPDNRLTTVDYVQGGVSHAITTSEGYTDTTVAGLDATVKQDAGDDGLALQVVETDGKLTSVTGSITTGTYATKSEFNNVAQTVSTLDGDESTAGSVKKQIKDAIAEVTTGTGGVTDLAGRMTTAESNIGTLQSGLSTANTNIGTNASDISGLKTRMTEAEGDIGTLQTDLGTANTNIGTNTNDISGLKTRMTTAEGEIDDLQAGLSTAEGNITTLEETVSGHTTSIGTNTTNIGNLTTRMTTAEGDIDALEAKVGSTSVASQISAAMTCGEAGDLCLVGHDGSLSVVDTAKIWNN